MMHFFFQRNWILNCNLLLPIIISLASFGTLKAQKYPAVEGFNSTNKASYFKDVVGNKKPNILIFTNDAYCSPCRAFVKKISESQVARNHFETIYISTWWKPTIDLKFDPILSAFNKYFKSLDASLFVDKESRLLKYYHGNSVGTTTIPLILILTPSGVETYRNIGLYHGDFDELLLKELDRINKVEKFNTLLNPLIDDTLGDSKKSIVFIDKEANSLIDPYLHFFGNKGILKDFSVTRFPTGYRQPVKVKDTVFKFNNDKNAHELTKALLKENTNVASMVFLNEKNEIITVFQEGLKTDYFEKILNYIGRDYYLELPWADFILKYPTLPNKYSN